MYTLALKNILLFTKCSPNYFSYFTKTGLPRGFARFYLWLLHLHCVAQASNVIVGKISLYKL